MKRRASFVIAIVVILTLVLSGCINDNQYKNGQSKPTETPSPTQQPTAKPEPTPTADNTDDQDQNDETGTDNQGQNDEEETKVSDQLIKLLPSKEGYKWVYNGFAEYGHELILEDIREEKDKIIYSAKGKVFDMSDGESDKDFSLSVDYTITSDELIQNKTGEMMMDLFDSMVIVQLPLEVGHSWTQKVKGADGKEVELKSTIVKVELDDGGTKLYTVDYQDKNSDYYEQRIIKEGIGVVGFTRLYMTEEGNFEITYWLYEEASGYDK
ncbi:MAG TPA: hypothetical protein GX505_01535 [Clostridiales bacterium]|nr:hypothetical protein [Clostridiales bacterium]